MRKNWSQKVLSLLLALVMVLGMLPVGALAVGNRPFTATLNGTELDVTAGENTACMYGGEGGTDTYVITVPAGTQTVALSDLASGAGVYLKEDFFTENGYVENLETVPVLAGDDFYCVFNEYTYGTFHIIFAEESATGGGDTGENVPPTRKAGVEATATASVMAGKPYSVTLSDIFEDANGDTLTYQVSINGAESITAKTKYSYTPTAEGTYTLTFTASDGKATSTDTYTVTLTATEALSEVTLACNATIAASATLYITGPGGFEKTIAESDFTAGSLWRTISLTGLKTGNYAVTVKNGDTLLGACTFPIPCKIGTRYNIVKWTLKSNTGWKAGMDYEATAEHTLLGENLPLTPIIEGDNYSFVSVQSELKMTITPSTSKQAEYYTVATDTKTPYNASYTVPCQQVFPDHADITTSYQSDSGFGSVPKTLLIMVGTASTYGYTNAAPVGEHDVSALDVLVAMHKDKLGDSFTAESAKTYLSLDDSGAITKLFGADVSDVKFTVDGASSAAAVHELAVTSGQTVSFYTGSQDRYTGFEQDGSPYTAGEAKVGEPLTLTLKGIAIGSIAGTPQAIAGAQLCLVNADGTLTPIPGAVTDANGTATVSFASPGEKLLSARATSGTAFLSPAATITVTAAATYPTYENKVYDDFENDLWLQYDYKSLSIGDTTDIFPRRVPQALSSVTDNDVERPNFNFEIVEGDSVKLSTYDSRSKTTVTAVKAGTSVVMVTYDAFTHSKGGAYPACSTVNTAYVVFAVGEEGTVTPTTSIKQRSYDTIYFTGESTPLTFTVQASGAKSYAVTCNGEVLLGENNQFTAQLQNRSNIIGVVATDQNGKTKSVYQVVDARKIEITTTNTTSHDGHYYVGDTVEVAFKGITLPVYKLATIYNPTYRDTTYGTKGTYVAYQFQGSEVNGATSQWDLATNNTITLNLTQAGTQTLSGGHIYSEWWGDPLGTDKTNQATGGSTGGGGDRPMYKDTFSTLPDLTLEVAPKEAPDYPTSVQLDKAKVQLDAGSTTTLTAAVLPFNANNKTLSWSSQTPGVATVDQSGKITAVAAGKTVITVKTANEAQSASCEVEVFAAGGGTGSGSKSVTISVDKLTINKGYVLTATQEELSGGDSVWDVTKRVLDVNGISFDYSYSTTYNSVYISAIAGDGEFDHGSGSGWMYSVNGVYPQVGCSAYTLAAGDVIRWRYTTNLGQDVGGGSSTNDSAATGGDATGGNGTSQTLEVSTTVSGSTATATVTDKQLTTAIKDAKQNGDGTIKIIPTETGSAKNICVTLPKSAAQAIVDDTNVSLVVETNGGNVTIPNDALGSITSQAGGSNITVAVEQKTAADVEDKSVDTTDAVVVAVTVQSGDKPITSFGGKSLTITIPVTSKFTEGQSYKVIEISADGTAKTLTGKCVKAGGKLYVQVSTTGLSTFVATTQKAMLFNDVSGHWALEGIQYAYNNGLFSGTSDTTFSPDTAMTRAMLVTVLYRMEGSPAVTAASSFADVKAGQYYTDAVIWANANGIVGGYGKGLFGTNDSITREQLAAILYRYAQYKKYDTTQGGMAAREFSDYESISSYATEAMTWAVNTQLLQGSDGKLMPAGTATRAQVATILMRFAENAAK